MKVGKLMQIVFIGRSNIEATRNNYHHHLYKEDLKGVSVIKVQLRELAARLLSTLQN